MIIYLLFIILYFLKICSRRGEVVVLYLPCVRNGTYRRLECFSVRYYKVGHGSVRGFLNSSNAVTCGVLVLSICRFVDLSFCRFVVLSCRFVILSCVVLTNVVTMSFIICGVAATTYYCWYYMYNCRVGSSSIQIHSPASLFGSTCTFQVSCMCARDRGGMAHFKR